MFRPAARTASPYLYGLAASGRWCRLYIPLAFAVAGFMTAPAYAASPMMMAAPHIASPVSPALPHMGVPSVPHFAMPGIPRAVTPGLTPMPHYGMSPNPGLGIARTPYISQSPLRYSGTYGRLSPPRGYSHFSNPLSHQRDFASGEGGAYHLGNHGTHFRNRHLRVLPLFLPFAAGDVASYALSPDADGDGLLAGYGSDSIGPDPYAADSQYGAAYESYADMYPYLYPSSPETGSEAPCSGLAPGLTDLPLQRIERAVHPTKEQRSAFENLKSALTKAVDALKQSCPASTPLTPVARLDVFEQQLRAMQDAAVTLRGPLETFYDLLGSTQKRRFDAAIASLSGRSAKAAKAESQKCASSTASFADVPAQDIEKAVHLDDEQRRKLQSLQTVSAEAAKALSASCSPGVPVSPVARIDAIKTRITALLQAIGTIRPAVSAFYSSLSDEQKAHFNLMG
jgi:hypothetical protein